MRVSFAEQTAFVFAAQVRKTNAVFCRSCGRAVGRKHQADTLLSGWWGVLSFFRNVAFTIENANWLRTLGRMEPPSTRLPEVATPLPAPMDEGATVFRRAQFWCFAALCVGLVGLMVVAGVQSGSGSTSGSQRWAVGSCVKVAANDLVTPVSCGATHYGIISAKVSSPKSCPADSSLYVETDSAVWCIRGS
jgi:hypothetical protein